jgi:hypothetical protein
MNLGYNGLWGLLILAGDIWAVINILQSSATNEKKLLWVIVVALLPLIGLILWYFLGPRDGKPSRTTQNARSRIWPDSYSTPRREFANARGTGQSSTLTPAMRAIFPHFSISALMNALNCSGVLPTGSDPS